MTDCMMRGLHTSGLAVACLLAHLSCVQANVWTVDCGVLTTQRMDPIVFPGEEPAGHVHAVVGGSRFDQSSQYDDLQQSHCTTCNVAKDLSNYWVPQLYVKKQRDGKFHHVDMDFHVYYKLINDRGQTDYSNNPLHPGDMNAFPPGFQVLAGSPGKQEEDHNIQHKCMGPNTNTYGFPPNPEDCWAIRAEITFPSCWKGEGHLGTEDDHSSHMSYPEGGHWEAGACPSTHPERLPTLFFEAIYLTGDTFEAGDQLVYSYNDWTGYGFHGDFLMGWNDGVIESMIDYCMTHEDGMATQCNNEKAGPAHCPWEGSVDEGKYKGVLDNLPECSGPYCGPY